MNYELVYYGSPEPAWRWKTSTTSATNGIK